MLENVMLGRCGETSPVGCRVLDFIWYAQTHTCPADSITVTSLSQLLCLMAFQWYIAQSACCWLTIMPKPSSKPVSLDTQEQLLCNAFVVFNWWEYFKIYICSLYIYMYICGLKPSSQSKLTLNTKTSDWVFLVEVRSSLSMPKVAFL